MNLQISICLCLPLLGFRAIIVCDTCVSVSTYKASTCIDQKTTYGGQFQGSKSCRQACSPHHLVDSFMFSSVCLFFALFCVNHIIISCLLSLLMSNSIPWGTGCLAGSPLEPVAAVPSRCILPSLHSAQPEPAGTFCEAAIVKQASPY